MNQNGSSYNVKFHINDESINIPPIIYLDFAGKAVETTRIDDVTVCHSKLSYEAMWTSAAALNAQSEGSSSYVLDRPLAGDYSTIFIGYTDSFNELGSLRGTAETIDEGNQNKNDTSFVILSEHMDIPSVMNIIAHEAGQLIGIRHESEGINAYGGNEEIIISSGEIISGGAYGSGHSIEILDGGLLRNATLNAVNLSANSGGIASRNTLNDCSVEVYGRIIDNTFTGGIVEIKSGGSAVRNHIISGNFHVNSGGDMIDNQVSSGGNLHISGGNAYGNFINADGNLYLYDGIAQSNFIFPGGAFHLYGGSAVNNYIRPEAVLHIYSGFAASNYIFNDGVVNVNAGGIAHWNIIFGDGELLVSSGGAAGHLQVSSGGNALFEKGAILNGANTILLGGSITANGMVMIGDDASITLTIGDSAAETDILFIDDISNFSDISIFVSVSPSSDNSGHIYKLFGGASDDTVITLLVGGASAALTSETSFFYDGYLYSINLDAGFLTLDFIEKSQDGYYAEIFDKSVGIGNNESAIDCTVITSQGRLTLYYGGESYGTNISSGGREVVLSSAVASGTIVSSGGKLIVSSGGSALSVTQIKGGAIIADVLDDDATTVITDQFGNVLLSNGTASKFLVSSGGRLTVHSGGSAIGISQFAGGNINFDVYGADTDTVISGKFSTTTFYLGNGSASRFRIFDQGYMTIHSGGIANITHVSSGGNQMISSGGNATSTTIFIGGTQRIASGATATNAIASGGVQKLDGGIALSAIIGAKASQYISDGGLASKGTVKGLQTIHSGGMALDVSFTKTGIQIIESGALSVETIQKGTQELAAGGSSIQDTITGKQNVSGNANETIIGNAGKQFVLADGNADNVTINSGGRQYVYENGNAINTILNGKASQIIGLSSSTQINLGGIVSDTVINGTSARQNFYGGTASNTTVSRGRQNIIGGVADVNLYHSGTQHISSGGTARSNTFYSAGAIQYISSGGSALSNIFFDGAKQMVKASGNAIDNTLVNNASQVISKNGFAENTVLNNNGSQVVKSGGSAVNTIVNFGGVLKVGAGASVSGIQFNSGVAFEVSSARILNSITINSGARVNVKNKGLAAILTMNGGSAFILSGGSASNTTINSGGQMFISSGGVATDTYIKNGGLQTVRGGALVNGTTVSSGGTQIILPTSIVVSSGYTTQGGLWVEWRIQSATVIGTKILSGGIQITSNAMTSDTQIYGIQTIKHRASSLNDVVMNQGLQEVTYGSAQGTRVNYGGRQTVYSNGFTTDAIIFGIQEVKSGNVSKTIVSSGGWQAINNGTAILTTVGSGASQTVNGGIASSTHIKKTAVQLINANGRAINTYIDERGTQNIYGLATGNTIVYRGVQNIYSGGIGAETIISSAASQFVHSAGTADGLTLLAGGSATFYAGAKMTGIISVTAGLTANGSVDAAFATIDFMMAERKTTDQAMVNNLANIRNADYRAIVLSDMAKGIYQLAGNIGSFTESMTLIADTSVNDQFIWDGTGYNSLVCGEIRYTLYASAGKLAMCVGGRHDMIDQKENIYIGNDSGYSNGSVYQARLFSTYTGTTIYGGSNVGTVNGNVDIFVEESTIATTLYGGGTGSSSLNGDVRITVIGAANITNIYLGGKGSSKVTGDAEIIFSTGYARFIGTTVDGSNVAGDSTLTFDSYVGKFKTSITNFDTLRMSGETAVNFDSAQNLAGISTWEFDLRNRIDDDRPILHWGAGSNDFSEDMFMIKLNNSLFGFNSWQLIKTNVNQQDNIFKNIESANFNIKVGDIDYNLTWGNTISEGDFEGWGITTENVDTNNVVLKFAKLA